MAEQTELHYAGHTWRPLLAEYLPDVVAALDCPEITAFMCFDGVTSVCWAVNRRWQSDLAANSATLVIHDPTGAIIGWAGLIAKNGRLETSTYLCPRVWGAGLNVAAKHLQWAICDLLDHPQMYLHVASDNARSQAAVWKLFPRGLVRSLPELDEPDLGVLIEVDAPPCVPGALSESETTELEAILVRLPADRAWRAAAGRFTPTRRPARSGRSVAR